MKSLLLSLLLCLFLVVPVLAQEEVEPQQVETFAFDLGISGDVFYPLTGDRKGKLLDGISLKVVAIKGELASVNLLMADMLSDRDTIYGAGVSVNIPLFVTDVLGFDWIADTLNPSIGLAALADFNAVDSSDLGINNLAIDPVIHLQIIKYEF